MSIVESMTSMANWCFSFSSESSGGPRTMFAKWCSSSTDELNRTHDSNGQPMLLIIEWVKQGTGMMTKGLIFWRPLSQVDWNTSSKDKLDGDQTFILEHELYMFYAIDELEEYWPLQLMELYGWRWRTGDKSDKTGDLNIRSVLALNFYSLCPISTWIDQKELRKA